MSLRSIAALVILVIQVVLPLAGCASVGKPSDPAIDEIERRHDEMMQRMGGGGGSM
jgi:hypothetical protein